LRHVPIQFCAREKFAVAFIDENVKHSFFERRVVGVTVQIPISIDEIDLDATSYWFGTIHTNSRIAEIGSGFPVPRPELDDVDLVAG
jgi:hypothetical protein